MNPGFDLFGENVEIRFRIVKNYVAALYERLDVLESQRLKRASQGVHLNQLLAADINPAQEGQVLSHIIVSVVRTVSFNTPSGSS